MARTKGAKDKSPRMPIGGFYKCQSCKRKRGQVNTLVCQNCNKVVCNDCWDFTDGVGCTHWLCPFCRVILVTEPANYLDEKLVEKLK